MSWREQIRPASFKGVAFGVVGDDKEAGRRAVVHEFPQREDAFVEDLGAVTNRFVIQAFVLGPDYMQKRDALERVLNEPGPGTLVHPWYGEITVSQAAPYKVKHAAQDGGMAVFTLSFAKDGAAASPAAGVNQQVRAIDKANQAGLLSCGAFDAAFVFIGQNARVIEQAYKSVTGAVARVKAILGGDLGAIADFLGAATGYDFMSWVSVGQRLWGVLSEIGSLSSVLCPLSSAWLAVASQAISPPATENAAITRQRIADNDLAVQVFTQRIAAVEAAKALAVAVPTSRAEAQTLRDNFVDVMDAILLPPTAVGAKNFLPLPDDLYVAFTAMRAATLAALAEAAHSAPDVITVTPAAVLPSLVLCYGFSGDIALEGDLVARNGIIHPGFVPAARLEALINGQ